MGTIPTKLTASSEVVDCPCGTSFLAYKSAKKKYCSAGCRDKYRLRGQNKGCKIPRPPGWKPSEKQLENSRKPHLLGRRLTKAHKETLRQRSLANWADEEYREKTLSSRPAFDEERRKALSEEVRRRWREGVYDDKPVYFRAGHGYHEGTWMRCINSEGVFARELDRVGISWSYEPQRFRLSWCSYTPDFYLPELDLWVEIKGFLSDESDRKIRSFREETGKTLSLIMQSDLPAQVYGGESD